LRKYGGRGRPVGGKRGIMERVKEGDTYHEKIDEKEKPKISAPYRRSEKGGW